MANFNELNVDLNNDDYFPLDLYGRTKDNPNLDLAVPCIPCNDPIDEYANKLGEEILAALED
ncbi:MAG: hypothetical protein FWG07_07255 [Treponema sp.]|nr:hypothetical protein [Treponema sp.]